MGHINSLCDDVGMIAALGRWQNARTCFGDFVCSFVRLDISGGSSFFALGWPVGGPADIMGGGQLQLGPM